MRPIAATLSLLVAACSGDLDDDGVAGPPGTDPRPGCTAAMTTAQQDVGVYLETTCSHAGCHAPIGTQAPSFAAADLPDLVRSGIYTQILTRMRPTDPLQIMPPSRASNSDEEIAIVQRWLDAGTPTTCATAAPAPAPEANSIPQGALFTCAGTAPPGPRLTRRVGSPEWVHAAGGVLTLREMVANPWRATSGPYSTFTANESIDASSFLLYLDTLSSVHGLPGYAFQPWYRRGGTITALGWDIGCMNATSHSADLPTSACRDTFIDASFHLGSFARAPSDEERAELRGFLDRLLAAAMTDLVAERDALRTSTGNATAEVPASEITARRNQVLDEVYDASFVMFGGLHRPQGEAEGRMSTDEIAIALMNALSTSLPNQLQVDPSPRAELGWVPSFRAAQMAGTLDSDAHLHDWVQTFFDVDSGYSGGASPSTTAYRADLQRDYAANSLEPLEARRGEYWLAPRIASFFREYFDYGGVAGVAKDDAGETSRWDFRADASGEDGRVSDAYGEIVAGTSDEPGMSDQLDDAIARTVVEAERAGDDVFRALLTGREYRVPGVPYSNARTLSSGTACNPATCVERECCTGDEVCTVESIAADGTPRAFCTGTYLSSWFLWPRMYMDGPPIVEDPTPFTPAPSNDTRFTLLLSGAAHEARWVTMPEGTRAGVLTHPTWLAAHGGNADNDPSIVHRGRWIREHLFCETVAGLDLVQLDASLQPSDTMSARARLEAAMGPSGDQRCANAACHGRMNTLGLPFEIYNHAGYLRATDHGAAPNGHSTITNWPGRGDVAIDDAVGLVNELAGDPYARRCFLRHVFRYFMGRYETESDACTLTAMESAFAGGSLMDALTALYTSPTFLYRTESTVTP